MAGGINLASGEKNVKPEENVFSRHMQYSPDGFAVTQKGFHLPSGWTVQETDEGIDGLYHMGQYPDLLWKAVNGKIYLTSATTVDWVEADTGIALTKDNDVFFTEYRGKLYYCNGADNAGIVSVGQLAVALVTGSEANFTVDLSVAATYQWTASGSGTDEYYLEANGGGDPSIPVEPLDILENSAAMSAGTVGSLATGEWDWGDNDTLGFDTIYVRLSDGTDPDSKADDYVQIQDDKIDLNPAEGNRFLDGTDKLYIGGDEIDYYDVVTDDIHYIRNQTGTHAVDAYVTEARTFTAPASGSLLASTMALWRDTMWLGGITDEPNVLRYSKTVSSVGTISNVEDFSDGNNYLIGEGGVITALLPTRDRLYVFTKDKVYYITIEISSAGAEVFSVDRVFSGNYGCPNAFCVEEMEDVVVFFTGDRLIRIGYDPENQQLLPDEKFDEKIFPILSEAGNYSQTQARLKYSPREKKIRLTVNIDNVLQTIVFDNRLDEYSFPDDHDASHWEDYKGFFYFGNRDNDKVYKVGDEIDMDSLATPHELFTGRYDLGDRSMKMFTKGVVEGFIGANTKIDMETLVNNERVGGYRIINGQIHGDLSSNSVSIGQLLIGGDVEIGGGGDTTELYPFRYPFVVMGRGEDFKLKFSSFERSAIWAIEKWQVEVVLFDAIPYTHY
jgi:hypothetical protein